MNNDVAPGERKPCEIAAELSDAGLRAGGDSAVRSGTQPVDVAFSRLPGWEDRLFAAIEAARSRPYRLGEHDCFRLACEVVRALTGADVWTPWAGSYSSKREALKRIAEFAGDFTAAASRFFGSEPLPMALARRGDVAEFAEPGGDRHLAIVMGVHAVVLGPEGLVPIGRDACRHCWRIG